MHALPRLRSAQIPTPMASPVVPCIRQSHQSPQSHQHQPAAGRAVREARTWIEAVTGRSFGEKETRAGLENGVLLCELLTSIKPGLVKRINRLETPIARQDNLTAFLRGCQDLGLSGSQLFDPGDLQDPSPSQDTRGNDSCKLQNVLITLYHLGRAANACPSYSGPTLDLGQFEDLLSQMQKEAEEADSAARSTRDSGYIDSWESERSDSLSPPAHARDDSLDSLDSLSTHSAHTPSPDALGPDALGSDALGLHACSDGPSDSESDGPFHRKMPDVRKDDMLARRTSVSEPKAAMPFNQYLPNKSNQSGYLPLPLRKKRDTSESRRTSESHRTSWSTATSPVGGDRPLRSVSLIDMRDGEDPHSQSRHELMHNQYNILKEDESHWQDDLARWKNRRRSVSQDLIKKEEERKQMEQLLTGETVVPHRRRSIKTYREIVEDKERREEELRVAYKSARSQEEASSILQRYAQRFSISEAILERLQLPKLLDVSSDPGCPFPLSLSLSPTEAPDHTGPLRYLRQQSAPSPRFTSTLEARVEEYPTERATHVPQIRSRSSEPPSSRALCPKAVPLLTPRPYSSSTDSWSGGNGGGGGKMDGLLRVNGASDGLPCTPDSSLDSPVFQSWTPTSPFSPGSSPLTPITPLTPESHSPVLTNHQGEPNHKTREESEQPSHPSSLPTELQKREESWSVTSLSDAKPDPSSAERSRPESQEWRTESAPVWIGRSSSDAASDLTNSVSASLSSSTPKLRWEFFAHSDETRKDLCENVSGSGPSRWSWDQKEERQRQRRWQEEQEQMLQEKYRVEQEKLRQEWERAQREVVEEERKYHQEEQRILEETTAPLTPVSPVSPVVPVQQDALSELHTQKENSEESRRRDYDRTSDISTADESMKTARSSLSHSSLQNGQSPSDQSKVSSPLQQTNNRQRRSGPLDNSSSSSKPPNASDCVPPSPNRSVSGKKLCSSCTQPLGKGAAMIIETLGLYFHIHCFKCGMCKGLLGDTTTGTDVRIRNGLLNCHQCYIRSRSSGQPTML